MHIRLVNLGTVNKNRVHLTKGSAHLVLTFSYETCVGFDIWGDDKDGSSMVRQNDWSTTTGKLLNEIEPDKKKRVNSETFLDGLEKAISRLEEGN